MKLLTLGVAGLLGLGLFASQAVAAPLTLEPTTKPEAAKAAKAAHAEKRHGMRTRVVPGDHKSWKGAEVAKARHHRHHRAGKENGLRQRLNPGYRAQKSYQTGEAIRKHHRGVRMHHQCPYTKSAGDAKAPIAEKQQMLAPQTNPAN